MRDFQQICVSIQQKCMIFGKKYVETMNIYENKLSSAKDLLQISFF